MSPHPAYVWLVCTIGLAQTVNPAGAASSYPATITRIVDGDTITVTAGSHEVIVRLQDIDAPESVAGGSHGARCDAERRLGVIAKARLKQLLPVGAIVSVRPAYLDRYGRTVAHIEWNGDDLGDELVTRGIARRWSYGFESKPDWC